MTARRTEYRYNVDGLLEELVCWNGSAVVTRHYHYSDRWQVLEERLDSSANAERLFVWGLQGSG